jgi:hypothetical protein
VYWRRRALAIGGTALVVLLFIWAVAALLGGSDSQTVRGAANVRADGPLLLTSSSRAAGSAAGRAPSSNPPGPSSAGAAPSTAPPSGPAAVPAGSTTVTSTTPPPPPGPPQPCPDAAVKVGATVGQPSYQVGQRPVLTLQITNIGQVACTRDLSHQLRALSVVALAAPATPLWTSSDCYQATTQEVRTLAPGQVVSYGLTWAGRTSAPGCPAARSTVPAGSYGVIGKLGPLASPPTPFTLTPAP